MRCLYAPALLSDQHLKDSSARKSRVTLLLGLRISKDRISGVVLRIAARCLHVRARWTREVTVRLLMIARRTSKGKVKSKAGAVERAGLFVTADDVGVNCRQAGGNVIAEHIGAIVKRDLVL